MTTAFQRNAFQNNAFQIDASDTHDGVFDADLWRKLQKKLKRKQSNQIEEEVRRAKELRETITAIIRNEDVPEPVRQQATQVIRQTRREAATVDFGPIASDVLTLNLQLQEAQRALLELAAAEWERQDEDDIELLLENL